MQDNILDDVISSIQPYIDNEEFQPDSIAEVSKVCTPLCQWVRAMHAYHFVAKAVEPKQVKTGICIWDFILIIYVKHSCTYVCMRVTKMLKMWKCVQQALQEAQKHLTATQNVLNDGKKRLTAVEGSIATLQAKYHDYQAQKNELHNKYQLFEARLIPANRVRGKD